MKFKFVVFTAASLLAVASATNNIVTPSPQQTDIVAFAAPTTNSDEFGVVHDQAEPVDACVVCHAAINTCVSKCGVGNSCKTSCTCTLKEDNLQCAHCESARCGFAADDTHVQGRPDNIQDIASTEGSMAHLLDEVNITLFPPLNACVRCQTSIRLCSKKCATPGACDESCRCYYKKTNRLCNECKIKCDCESTCPAQLSVEQRSIDSTPPTEIARYIGPKADLTPEAFTKCNVCNAAVNHCQKQCRTAHACDVCCKWDHKLHVDECKDCDITFDVNGGHCVDKLSLEQRSNIDKITPGIRDTFSSAEGVEPMGVPPWSPCLTCTYTINACKQKCSTPGACDSSCSCWHAIHNRFCSTCDPPCDCSWTCPRLARRQRQIFSPEDILADHNTLIEYIDDPNNRIEEAQDVSVDTPDMDIKIGGPPDPGADCWMVVNKCKKNCATPGACDNHCNCYYEDHKKCKTVPLPCNCRPFCPRRRDMFIEESETFNSLVERDDSVEHPDLNVAIPFPSNPAVECILAVNKCKKDCGSSGACQNGCNCRYKDTKKCKGVNLPCD